MNHRTISWKMDLSLSKIGYGNGGDQFVTFAFPMLLCLGMHIGGAQGRDWRAALVDDFTLAVPLLAQAFGQQLIVPQANRLQRLGPDVQHADGGSALLLQQMADAHVIQHGVLARRGGAEVLIHRCGTLEQRDDVQTQGRGW